MTYSAEEIAGMNRNACAKALVEAGAFKSQRGAIAVCGGVATMRRLLSITSNNMLVAVAKRMVDNECTFEQALVHGSDAELIIIDDVAPRPEAPPLPEKLPPTTGNDPQPQAEEPEPDSGYVTHHMLPKVRVGLDAEAMRRTDRNNTRARSVRRKKKKAQNRKANKAARKARARNRK